MLGRRGAENPHESRGYGVRDDSHSLGELYLRSTHISSLLNRHHYVSTDHLDDEIL